MNLSRLQYLRLNNENYKMNEHKNNLIRIRNIRKKNQRKRKFVMIRVTKKFKNYEKVNNYSGNNKN